MNQTTILIIAVIVVLVALFFFLVRGRKQHVSFEGKPEAMLNQRPAPVAKVTPAPATAPTAEGHGVGSEVSAAIEDVVDQFMGLDAHPSGQDQVTHAGDTLTTLKGLGPKAATRLNELGVTTFAQIAAWDEGDVQAIDAQLGAFKGRIRRDKWVEQARLLAKGDTAAFEEAYGKLG
ncbi:putative flap endonuclease-1-like 5' DNA nuclease [Sphingomonas vulcanisoli]|uniref:Flap endonuclease-1-like 5' DNA nuclease n=1 Tax=Sphingomonas vulcanisoli TaxID=1658060 RepID=A0ABX0TVF6_9SPHN|nr:hypothetical protein [Sphingomonas vulcanisoli]NIJ08340.1 putative flap endonuclease-1-like 5' DNA nuclease [Sphingomonas vulcanisoli]